TAPAPDDAEAVIREWHPSVGEWLLGRWQLPTVLRQAVLYHHTPQACPQFPLEARVAYLANRLSHYFGFGCAEAPDDTFLDDPVCQELAMTQEWLDDLSRRAPGLFNTTRQIVG